MLLPLPATAQPQQQTISIQARSFGYEPGTVRVRRGDTVTIHLESEDAVHGLFVDGYEVKLQAEQGRAAQATFVADRAGRFTMRCSVSCGALHPFMIGKLEVDPGVSFGRAALATLAALAGSLVYFTRRSGEGLLR